MLQSHCNRHSQLAYIIALAGITCFLLAAAAFTVLNLAFVYFSKHKVNDISSNNNKKNCKTKKKYCSTVYLSLMMTLNRYNTLILTQIKQQLEWRKRTIGWNYSLLLKFYVQMYICIRVGQKNYNFFCLVFWKIYS